MNRFWTLPLGACVFAAVLLEAGPTPAAPLRILPLGDSITRGSGALGGYRAPLYTLLTNAGYNVDFVGTQHDFNPPSLPDPDHEGHSGWRIDEIDAIILSVFAQIANPDVILLLIGTNDYGQGYDTAHAAERLEALIARMAVNRPSAAIIVANLLIRNEPYNTAIETTFNPFVPGIVARQAALGRLVYFTDLRSSMGRLDLSDNVHPNLSGYMKMATNWFSAVTNLFPADGGGRVSLVGRGAACRFHVPTNDALGLTWTSAEGFDDSGWAEGFSAVGYEHPRLAYTNYIRSWVPFGTWGVYVRWLFMLPAQGAFEARTLRVRYDDGFVAYLDIEWFPLAALATEHGLGRWEDSTSPLLLRRFYRLRHLGSDSAVTGDHLDTDGGEVIIHPVFHASLALVGSNAVIYADPAANRFTGLPPADIILFTHTHSDHFNAGALSGLAGSNAVIVAPPAVYELVPSPLRSRTTVLTNGAATLVMGVAVEAVPMYNTGSSPAHPRGQGNGYVLTMGGRRIYIAGDSSDTPEMRALTGLDVAFINIYDPLTTPL